MDINKTNCYDQNNDVCKMGHSAGTGSPIKKCCPYCDEWDTENTPKPHSP